MRPETTNTQRIMPKVLLYATAKVLWTFLFWGTDFNENRAHVHVGKRGTKDFAKIWLEPNVEVAAEGSLTQTQLNQVLKIAEENKQLLLAQWQNFKAGKNVKLVKINK